MSNYYTVKTDNVHACCNLILWDLLLTVGMVASTAMGLFPTLTGFQHFFIGLLGAIILLFLMVIPLLRNIIIILFSVFWGVFFYEILEYFFHVSNYSTAWRYGIGIFLFFIALAIHFASAEDMGMLSLEPPHIPGREFTNSNSAEDDFTDNPTIMMDIEKDLMQCHGLFNMAMSLTDDINNLPTNDDTLPLKKFAKRHMSNIVKQHNAVNNYTSKYNKFLKKTTLHRLIVVTAKTTSMLEEYINTIHAMTHDEYFSYYEQNTHSQHHDSDQNTSQETHNTNSSSYFKGCDTLEKLNKRYRDLVKIYHSDSGNGNDEVFIEITDEYNRLKNVFS